VDVWLVNFILMLQESRASSSAKDQLRSTRGSFFNRTLGRDTRPAWGNRIVKDFYDLDYDLTSHHSTRPNHTSFTNTQLLNKQRLKADLLKRTNRAKKQSNPEHSASPRKRDSSSRKEQKMSQSMGLHREEVVHKG